MADDKEDTVVIARAEYEQRHAALESRVSRLEERMLSLATREDIQNVKTEIVKEVAKMLPTVTDVKWLEKAFWWGLGAVTAIAVSGIGIMLGHLAGKF